MQNYIEPGDELIQIISHMGMIIAATKRGKLYQIKYDPLYPNVVVQRII